MMTFGIIVSLSMCIDLCVFNVANALLVSTANATVGCEGLGLLKLLVI